MISPRTYAWNSGNARRAAYARPCGPRTGDGSVLVIFALCQAGALAHGECPALLSIQAWFRHRRFPGQLPRALPRPTSPGTKSLKLAKSPTAARMCSMQVPRSEAVRSGSSRRNSWPLSTSTQTSVLIVHRSRFQRTSTPKSYSLPSLPLTTSARTSDLYPRPARFKTGRQGWAPCRTYCDQISRSCCIASCSDSRNAVTLWPAMSIVRQTSWKLGFVELE